MSNTKKVDSINDYYLEGLEDSLYCTECKVRTRIEYLYITKNNNHSYFAIAQCIDCERLTFFQYREKDVIITVENGVEVESDKDEVGDVELIYSFPFTSEIKIDDVPEKFANSYLEGVRCLEANAPNGSVAMFRRTLQQICVSRGADPTKRLVEQLNVLPNEVKPTATEIQKWGNLGAHEDSSGKILEVNRDQANSIKKFLEVIFMVLYQHPAELARRKQERM